MKRLLTFIVLVFSATAGFGQKEPKQEKDPYLPSGNDAFAEKNYVDAEADYRISQSRFPKKAAASYNLGNSIYTQKHAAEAKFAFAAAAKNAETRPAKHKAFHNLGNALMKEKDYQGAVQAYRNALVNDPSDDETRYNYALAKKMLKENPPKKDDKKDDKKDKKDDKKDQKKDKGGDQDKKDNQDNQDKKDQDKKDKGDQDKDSNGGEKPQDKPKPKPGGISEQRMENLLDAVNHEEKKVQEKVKGQEVKGRPVRNEKDW